MSIGDDPIEDQKPTADLQEQQRPDFDEPDDPESPAEAEPPFDRAEADPADVADQHEEVPLDEERREE
ncbi:hypothetical protein [Microbacterium sp. SD291]|uniref:hypothetical protein n=1 Tax=Microbacterium sp. SD291 TaxID=2782007 RepID=UPI001A96BFE1|nr:hypothetical protein [Microbacterium sp. SD291]MBO0982075.1 hypothetical protein [Microbacterium sp. SD291]